MDEYDLIAAWYVAARSPEVGIADLAALARPLPSRARVLDLGCGDGVPISRFFLRERCEVEGLDSSPAMIARYRDNFPGVPARCEQAQEADFPAETFDAVVAWGVLFHLPEADQRAVIRKVAAWLKPGGRFLFTSGEVEGATEGEMNGVLFRYVSLGVRGYRNEIERAGMRLEASSFDAWGNYVYRAAKPA